MQSPLPDPKLARRIVIAVCAALLVYLVLGIWLKGWIFLAGAMFDALVMAPIYFVFLAWKRRA
jgi:hypothetical protein